MKTLSNALVAKIEALLTRYGQMINAIPPRQRTIRQMNDLRIIKQIINGNKKMH